MRSQAVWMKINSKKCAGPQGARQSRCLSRQTLFFYGTLSFFTVNFLLHGALSFFKSHFFPSRHTLFLYGMTLCLTGLTEITWQAYMCFECPEEIWTAAMKRSKFCYWKYYWRRQYSYPCWYSRYCSLPRRYCFLHGRYCLQEFQDHWRYNCFLKCQVAEDELFLMTFRRSSPLSRVLRMWQQHSKLVSLGIKLLMKYLREYGIDQGALTREFLSDTVKQTGK